MKATTKASDAAARVEGTGVYEPPPREELHGVKALGVRVVLREPGFTEKEHR